MREPGSGLKNRLPAWFRQDIPSPAALGKMRTLLRRHALHTVCESARCPNSGTCWSRGTVTFMIMGDVCTRACRFCAVKNGQPLPLDRDEPERIARAVRDLALKYVVVTSVTRDDLPDEGAAHFAATLHAIKQLSPGVNVEVLVPDFSARASCVQAVVEAGPAVLGHNIETVRRLSGVLRPQADHDRSLRTLRLMREIAGDRVCVKSGLMVGLGETDEEVLEALRELKISGCTLVTIGQYLAPAADGRQQPVERFVAPEMFEIYRRQGLSMGFSDVLSGPLVRSSFLAEQMYMQMSERV